MQCTGCLDVQEVSSVCLEVFEAYLELQEANSAYLEVLEALDTHCLPPAPPDT